MCHSAKRNPYLSRTRGIMKRKKVFLSILLAALTVGLYFPTMRWLVIAWLNNVYYSHGLILFFISMALVWLVRNRVRHAAMKRGQQGIALLVIACSFYLIGFVIHQPTILAFSFLFFITALALQFLGTEKTRPLIFPIFLLSFAIPLPAFERLGILLQGLSASGATELTALFGMDVSSTGNSITIGGDTYNVALACSGLNRIMPLFSLTALLAYFVQGPILKRVILLFLVIPFALGANILRITTTLLVGSACSTDVALGFFHEFSSIVFFLLTLVPMILTARTLNLLRLGRITTS